MAIKNIVVFTLVIFPILAFCQNDFYHYQRSIESPSNTWHEIEFPEQLYEKVQANKHDIRIVSISETDTIEIGYVLRANKSSVEMMEVPFKKINETTNEEGFFVTFDVGKEEILDRIQLEFDSKNFDWSVDLEGSNNQREWFEILKDYRILSIENESTNYRFTSLNFDPVKYQYLRLKIKDVQKPNFRNALIYKKETKEGNLKKYTSYDLNRQEDKKRKRTKIHLRLPHAVPLNKIHIPVSSEVDYYRRVDINYVTDSTKTDKGYNYHYFRAGGGILSSLEENEFQLSNESTKHLLIIINNQDNQPLELMKPELEGPIYSLVARFDDFDKDYLLWYGKEYAQKPRYDLVNFQNKIPDTLKVLHLGAEKRIFEEAVKEEQRPLFQNKIWLWGLMLVIILLLGSFTFKMMKN